MPKVFNHFTAFLATIILVFQSRHHIATADRNDDDDDPAGLPLVLDPCNGAMCGRGTCVDSGNTTLGFECECEDGWMQAHPIWANFLNFLPCVIPNCTVNYTCAEAGPHPGYPNNPVIPNNPNYNPPNNPLIPNNPNYNPNNPLIPNTPNYNPNHPLIPNTPNYNPNNPLIPNYPYSPNNPNNPLIPNYPYNPNNPPYYGNNPSNNGNNPYYGNGPFNLSSNPCFFSYCGGGICIPTSPFTHACICRQGFYNLFNASVFPCYRECAFGAGCSSLGINATTSILDPNPFLDDDGTSLICGAEFGCLIAVVTTLTMVIWRFI